MRIITEVESSPRGVYCGAIGWVAPPTEPVRARFNVASRTAVVDRRYGSVVYGTLKALVGIRLGQEEEYNGADLTIHRITATPDTRDL